MRKRKKVKKDKLSGETMLLLLLSEVSLLSVFELIAFLIL